MAKTLVLDQAGNRLGYMPGFRNYVLAFVDEYGVPWLPIDGLAFHELAHVAAHRQARIVELELEVETLRNQIDD